MADPKSPLQTAWSAVWLVLLATLAVWLFIQLLSQIWIWLLLLLILAAAITALVLWLRHRANRW